ncbi:UV-stimulated scaffold protein A [Biomphalaria glabrata]|nr:UV-stimulated scaffold protein A-like [Biomphalaria glabrata]KAI8793501.1 UV-stimulated scaffold protein A [Biomphalaria glabrata]
MDKLNIEEELKKSVSTLNPDITKQMKKCVHELTNTGNPSLPEAETKKFKRLCRESDDYVRYAFYLIMKQLTKNHSEIRLSAFQLADELFNRSHAFREILVLHLQQFLALTTALEVNKPLPPPSAAANKLKSETLLAIQRWYEKYGKGYRKLVHGYDYLKNCKFVDFTNLQAQNQAERLRIEKEEKRKQKAMADKVTKVLKEISETQQEIVNCATETENCLKLLLPTTSEETLMDFFSLEANNPSLDSREPSQSCSVSNQSHNMSHCTNLDRDKSKCLSAKVGQSSLSGMVLNNVESMDDTSLSSDNDCEDEENDLVAHGYNSTKFTLSIEVLDKVSVQETTDNTDIMQSLKDSSKLIDNTYLPKVIRWLEILSKNGGKENDIKSAIDLKIHLETIKSKCVDLKLVSMETNKTKLDDSDDDFEEVPEKEGFEPHIPPHLRAEYGLTDNATTQAKPQLVTVSSESSSKTSTGWNLKERLTSQVAADPTTMANALAKVESQSLMSTSPKMSRQNSQETASTIPFVEFGADLACWENPDQIEVPSVIKYDSLHRFWTPKETETEKPSQHELSALKNRVFSFPGKFEPVKWNCRAPMPNGKVCERMDRIKCPFHGTIIARDETGKPSNVTDSSEAHQKEVTTLVEQEEPSTSCCNESLELPPWQDPELQREIEHATGHDLGSARSQKLLDKATKGKGKGKKSKKSNLTNIKAIQNTTHKRLSAKVFNKRSLKKVCATLDNCDYKRIRDKFGNQFHYSLK